LQEAQFACELLPAWLQLYRRHRAPAGTGSSGSRDEEGAPAAPGGGGGTGGPSVPRYSSGSSASHLAKECLLLTALLSSPPEAPPEAAAALFPALLVASAALNRLHHGSGLEVMPLFYYYHIWTYVSLDSTPLLGAGADALVG